MAPTKRPEPQPQDQQVTGDPLTDLLVNGVNGAGNAIGGAVAAMSGGQTTSYVFSRSAGENSERDMSPSDFVSALAPTFAAVAQSVSTVVAAYREQGNMKEMGAASMQDLSFANLGGFASPTIGTGQQISQGVGGPR